MKIIIKVEDGLVQAVYADGEVDVEVIDLDIDVFADEAEEKEFDECKKQMEETIKKPEWRMVW